MNGFIIAIDGPVAAGKGTIAPELAATLGGFYLYTGGTYRALTFYCLEHNIDVHNADKVIAAIDDIVINLKNHRVLLNDGDVTAAIKKSDVANNTPKVAAIPEVRQAMVQRQQAITLEAIQNGEIVIAEGRDTGTKVFPDAALKVYLTASDEVRARRRQEQYRQHGEHLSIEDVLREVRNRDKRDLERDIDPLPGDPEAAGYFIVDNSNMSEAETVQAIKQELHKRKLV